MQPDKIIQEKEWQELTDANRKSLEPLVNNEADYRLLKKALILSKETAGEVPAVRPEIKGFLMKAFKENTPVQKMQFSYWRKIAAAIIILSLSSMLYWLWMKTNKSGKNNTIAKNTVPVWPNIVPVPFLDTPPAMNQKKPASLKNTFDPLLKKETLQESVLTKIKPGRKKIVPLATDATLVNTLVQADTMLLAYITEVY